MSPTADHHDESILAINSSHAKTRRRALDSAVAVAADYNNTEEEINISGHDFNYVDQYRVGFCTILHSSSNNNNNNSRRLNFLFIMKCLRPRKNLRRWISILLTLLAVSTFVFKIMLMNSFLTLHSNSVSNDFLRRPQLSLSEEKSRSLTSHEHQQVYSSIGS